MSIKCQLIDKTKSPLPPTSYKVKKFSCSRPTTRTTKTISDGTDSSRSSVLLDGGRTVVTRGDISDNTNDNIDSFLRGDNDNMESYISFQSDIRLKQCLTWF